MSDHDSYSDSHSVWPEGAFVRTLGKFGLRHTPGGEISNERAGYLHFHGFYAFGYFWSGIFDFNFISTRNRRAVAKRSDAVLPGIARSYSTPVRRISRSLSSDANLPGQDANSTEAGLGNCRDYLKESVAPCGLL
jgi:hypothetical protein